MRYRIRPSRGIHVREELDLEVPSVWVPFLLLHFASATAFFKSGVNSGERGTRSGKGRLYEVFQAAVDVGSIWLRRRAPGPVAVTLRHAQGTVRPNSAPMTPVPYDRPV